MDDYPTTDDGSLDHETAMDQMGIETNEHPINGTWHRFGDECFEVYGVSGGYLQASHPMHGQMEIQLTELYADWRDGMVVSRCSRECVDEAEVVVNRLHLSVLADLGAAIFGPDVDCPDDVVDAVDHAYEKLGHDSDVSDAED